VNWSERSRLAGVMLAWCALVPCVADLSAQSAPIAPTVVRGTVRTDTLWAQSLGVRKALTVYLPPSYGTDPRRRYPLLVYLHGLGGNERNWVDAGRLDRAMDSLVAAGAPEAIVAMPDGDDSWYTTFASLPDVPGCQADSTRRERADSFCVPWPHYDDYIARDIVGHMDRVYRTVPSRRHRAIGGLSMGGYGAVSLALAYPDVFAAAASHSGVLSPRLRLDVPATHPDRYAGSLAQFEGAARTLWTSQRLAFGSDSIAWSAREPGTLAARLATRVRAGTASWPALHIDVGVNDAWLLHNRDFVATLTALSVPHSYREHPGGHTWEYWRHRVGESLSFLLERVR
jgi:putative tributyrin esterase